MDAVVHKKKKCPFVGDVGKGIFFVAVMKKTGNLVILYKVGKHFGKWLFVDNHIDKERKFDGWSVCCLS